MKPQLKTCSIYMLLVFSLVACSDPQDNEPSGSDSTTQIQSQEQRQERLSDIDIAGDSEQSHRLREPDETGAHEDDLEAEDEREHGDEAHNGATAPQTIHLTPDQRRRLDIEVGTAIAGAATEQVQAPATVTFDADQVARVGPRLKAKVVEVTKDLGEQVEAGEVVAVLDSVELGRAKARLLITTARFEAALAEYRRDQTLAEEQITSKAELLESRANYLVAQAERDAAHAELKLYGLEDSDINAISGSNQEPLSRYRLNAPIAGTIQQRDLVPGQSLSPEETPIHIVNDEHMWVMLEAYEQDLPRLQPGQTMSLSVPALPGRDFEGVTDWVSRELDQQSRTIGVRAVVANPEGRLRAGMFGTATVQTNSEQRFALVPVDAVQTIEGETVVFVPGSKTNEFEAIEVVTGAEGGGQIEIREGLAPNDAVVVIGAFDLNSALTAGSRSADHGH